MTNTDPVCPNCGRYLAHVGLDHFMVCHLQPEPSGGVFAEPLTSTTDTAKRLSDVDYGVLAAQVANCAAFLDSLKETYSAAPVFAEIALQASDAIERLSAPPSQGKVERAREILAQACIAEHLPLLAAWLRKGSIIEKPIAVAALRAISDALTEPAQGTSVEAMREAAAKIVIGWRECDWPEGFDRNTAEFMAQDRAERIRALPVSEDGSAKRDAVIEECAQAAMINTFGPIGNVCCLETRDNLEQAVVGAIRALKSKHEGDGE